MNDSDNQSIVVCPGHVDRATNTQRGSVQSGWRSGLK